MAKKVTPTTLDLALQSVYDSSKKLLMPKDGEYLIAAKVEKGMFASAVFGQNANVALAMLQFLTTKPEIMTAFFTLLLENTDFKESFLSGIVKNNSPEDVFKFLREKYLLVAIPNETPKEEMLETLDKIKETILNAPENETGNETPAEEKA